MGLWMRNSRCEPWCDSELAAASSVYQLCMARAARALEYNARLDPGFTLQGATRLAVEI